MYLCNIVFLQVTNYKKFYCYSYLLVMLLTYTPTQNPKYHHTHNVDFPGIKKNKKLYYVRVKRRN